MKPQLQKPKVVIYYNFHTHSPAALYPSASGCSQRLHDIILRYDVYASIQRRKQVFSKYSEGKPKEIGL